MIRAVWCNYYYNS